MSTTRKRKSICFFASENSTEDQQNKVFSHIMSLRRSVKRGKFSEALQIISKLLLFF